MTEVEMLEKVLRQQREIIEWATWSNALAVIGRVMEIIIASGIAMIYSLKVRQYQLQKDTYNLLVEVRRIVGRRGMD